MPTKTEAVGRFLTAKTHSDLANLYMPEMEVQINVAKDAGEPITGEYKGRPWRGYTDGLQTWKPFRIPWKANTEPEYIDSEIRFDLEAHVEAIGMTGWNWVQKTSLWVAYDFDDLTTHTSGLTYTELQEVQNKVRDIDWVSIRKSTSGSGIHLYVLLEPVKTATHTEHAALSRAILGKLAALTAFDFQSKVDTCGGNMWVWHRKMNEKNGGLVLLKEGRKLTSDEVPTNWMDHLKVIKRKRGRSMPRDKMVNTDTMEFLANQKNDEPLDEGHEVLIKYLEKIKALWWWDQDLKMLVTHTGYLEKAFTDLNLAGVFKTNSAQTNLDEQNCFSGNTEIITKEGVFTFKYLVNKEVDLYVYTPFGYRWIKSKIKEYGEQELHTIRFDNYSIVRTTANHQWLYYSNGKLELYNRLSTIDLTNHTELPLASFELPLLDKEGYAHGFVYGDGWQHEVHNKLSCEVSLFKNDNDLCTLLCQYGNLANRYYEGHGNVNTILRLPEHWKQLPDNPTKEYALGFILGLIFANGYVCNHIQIYQSNYIALNEIRKLAIYAGLRCNDVRPYGQGSFDNAKMCYTFTINTYNMSKDLFLRKDQRDNFVKRSKDKSTGVPFVSDTVKKETVYCAEVPEWHNFTLANGVVTGNCFLFPLRGGAWSVRRYTRGAQEESSWTQDGQGWTRCYFNQEPDLQTAASMFGGVEDKKGKYAFRYTESALKASELLGIRPAIPNGLMSREAKIYKRKEDGRLAFEIEKKSDDTPLEGWSAEKSTWFKAFPLPRTSTISKDPEIGDFDESLRHLVTITNDDCGWNIYSDNEWRTEPIGHIQKALRASGFKQGEIDVIMGSAVLRPWVKVNKPLQPEYPGNREWNRGAAQLAFPPTENLDNLYHPTWTNLLDHCGEGLNESIENNPWAKVNGLQSGGDYLKCWIAALLQFPFEPLPYLFFHGEQDVGKSIFHEAIYELLTTGVKRADAALISQSNFNAELEDAIVCIVEEIDLENNKNAYNRIKDWVTGRQILIHRKGATPYQIPNTTHWIQTNNNRMACPVFPGDTRITMLWVQPLDPLEKIPKNEFINLLRKEAPDFLASVLNLELPPSRDRLKIPIIETGDKLNASEQNMNPVQRFLAELCYYSPGEVIKFSILYDKFQEFIDPNESAEWKKPRFTKSIPLQYPKGRQYGSDANLFVGNISFEKTDIVKPVLVTVCKDGDIRKPYLESKRGQ